MMMGLRQGRLNGVARQVVVKARQNARADPIDDGYKKSDLQ
ncbi:hypothetical protein RESH_01635 [Rhodopirellula europaea SH398]|uniref:Uncharacterized protein n=1 Tax=Rhodopirellula europaea SH398 TaxID=1263868 RepID=M5SNF5_9BACT|nr:hypothetical protein RESH_01635 [Rhodopirellula europaea SH398]